MALVALLLAPGCNLLASAVPCRVDENCAPGERCLEGFCALDPSLKRDAGRLRDAGPTPEDAGPPDAGDPLDCDPHVVVSASAPVPAGQPLKLTLDHASLVALGFSPDGADLHLVHEDGVEETSLARALDPLSAWNREDTELWFRLPFALSAGESTDAFRLRRDAENPPSGDEREVFPVADFFERPDDTPLEAPWRLPYGGVSVVNGGIELEGLDANNRPLLDLELPPQTGAFELRLGWGFARIGAETEYRLHLLLGEGAVMPDPPEEQGHFAADGASVSLVWSNSNQGQGFQDEETLAAHVHGGFTPIGVVSGQRHMVLRVDPPHGRYDVVVDGEPIGETLPFLPDSSKVLTRFRLVAWRLGVAIEQRRFEYVYLVPRLEQAPTLHVQIPAECAAADAGPGDAGA